VCTRSMGRNAYTRAERGGGGGFGSDERPHMFVIFVWISLWIEMRKDITIGRVES